MARLERVTHACGDDVEELMAIHEYRRAMKDLRLRCYKEHGIRCEVAPVSGHNFTGLVERKIRQTQPR